MQDLAKAMMLTPEEIAEFNAKCDYLASKMSAEEAVIYLARTYTAEERMAFMMASAITLSLIGDGLLYCPTGDGHLGCLSLNTSSSHGNAGSGGDHWHTITGTTSG